jgi:NTP pyrophosphatase (non-canonical NTP hydrolase)
MKELRVLQNEVGEWGDRNFPDSLAVEPLLGVAEEVGELCHAQLKGIQGIRHTPVEIYKMKKDAVGDILIFLAHYCHKNNLDLQDCLEQTWSEVKQRDWSTSPMTGKAMAVGVPIPIDESMGMQMIEFKPFGFAVSSEDETPIAGI